MLSGLDFKYVKIKSSGSVYPVKSGKHTMGFAFYYQEEGKDKKRKVVTGCNEEELKDKAIKFLESIEAGHNGSEEVKETVENTRKTYREVADLWFAEYKLKQFDKKKPISFSSVESRRYSLQRINKVVGDMFIDEITQEIANDVIDKCSIKPNGSYYSKSDVTKLEQAFQLVMKYGREKGYCDAVLERVELDQNLKVAKNEDRFLDREQLEKIAGIIENNPRYRIIFKVLISTGLRQEELFALFEDDFKVLDTRVEVTINKTIVEVARSKYELKNKTKSVHGDRKVYIPLALYNELMAYYESVIENESDYDVALRKLNNTEKMIFVNKNKEVINKRTFQRNFGDYVKRNAGKEIDFDCCLHMLRHSHGSLLAENLPLEKVAKLLGDTTNTVYNNYYSMSDKSKDEVINNISDIIDSIY